MIAPSFLGYPLQFDGAKRTAVADLDNHVRQMVEQVLFTAPGERLNRPDFGCGLGRMVFAPNSEVLATATQFLVRGALQRWLADVIRVDDVVVTTAEEQLVVEVRYVRLNTARSQVDRFTRALSARPGP
jgi:phage baseplate assembly protein W